MKKTFTVLFALLIFSELTAQQNLFNIPSGDITPNEKFFYQHQFNFYKVDELESKSHVVYGLGRGWDMGINFVDLPLRLNDNSIISYNSNTSRKPLYPLLMLTLQKQWKVSEHLEVNIGTQTGSNLSTTIGTKRFVFFNYAIARFTPVEKIHFVAGPYHTNNVFVGGPPDQRVGFMVGYEYRLTKKILLMGDFISGNHKKSQTVLGGGYTFGNRVQLFIGALLTYPNKELKNGAVIELNWYGWDFIRD
jgi:hypothetical protein